MRDLGAIKKLNSKKGVGQKLGRHNGKPTTKKKKKAPKDDLSRPTLEALLKEAQGNCDDATFKFDQYDNHEDMAEMEMWGGVIDWLEGKLAG